MANRGDPWKNLTAKNQIRMIEPGEISGFSDEQVLREFEEAMKSTIPLPPPPENEFEQICQRIEKENRMEQIDGFL